MRKHIYKYLLDNYLIINYNYVIEDYNETFRLLMNWGKDQYINKNLFELKALHAFTIFLDELKYKGLIINYEMHINKRDYRMSGVWNAQDKIFLIKIVKEIK